MTLAQEVIRGRIAAIDGELEDIERQRQSALDLRRELAELEAAIATAERGGEVAKDSEAAQRKTWPQYSQCGACVNFDLRLDFPGSGPDGTICDYCEPSKPPVTIRPSEFQPSGVKR